MRQYRLIDSLGFRLAAGAITLMAIVVGVVNLVEWLR